MLHRTGPVCADGELVNSFNERNQRTQLPPVLMIKPSRNLAGRLAAAGLLACLCGMVCPLALGATTSGGAAGHARPAAKRDADAVGRDRRAARPCASLVDGRGERVLSATGSVDKSVGNECATVVARPRRDRPTAQTNAQAQPLVVGPAQAARRSDSRGEAVPIVARIGVGRLSATLLTTGTAMLLLQSSLSTYLLLLGLPFWRHVDLLPIVDSADDEAGPQAAATNADEEHAIGQVLDAQSPPRDAARARP